MSLLIAFVVAAVVMAALGLAAARGMVLRRPADLTDLEVLFYKGPDRYAHLSRILAHTDFDFLAASRQGKDLVGPLRRRRVACMRRSLVEIEEEFNSLMSLGSLFAASPTAQAESLARRLSRQRLRFYRMLYSLKFRALVNYLVLWPLETAPLSAEIRTLRRQTDRVLHALTPDDLGVIRNVLRSS